MLLRVVRSVLVMVTWLFIWGSVARWLTSEAMAPTREDHRQILFLTGVVFGAMLLAIVDGLWEAAKRRRQ